MKRGGLSLALYLLAVSALAISVPASQDGAAPRRQPLVFTTPPEIVRGQLVRAGAKEREVSARAIFTLKRAQLDDTLVGRLMLTLDEKKRAEIAAEDQRSLANVPASFMLDDVVARFRRDSACPIAHIEFEPLAIASAGYELRLPHLVLTIAEGSDEMTPQLCFWARQINAGKSRRGIIAAINRLIDGGPEPD